ncbi:hypothetical protein FRC08_010294 [Ceratobasidium sp. 394]|nr:hypothetical protein FRC08_010294 [Ceratobasidium sp. 394]
MPSFGGFYVSPAAWTEWLRAGDYPGDRWGSPYAEAKIDDKIREINLRHLFGVCAVPIPNTEPKRKDWGLMIYQRQNRQRRIYFPPMDGFDVNEAKQVLEERLGIKMTHWKSLWYDPHSIEQVSYFLTPPDEEDEP